MDFEIKELSQDFYSAYPPAKFPEIMSKPNRPYLVMLITIDGNTFGLPFRTNIRHNECFKFKTSTRNTSSVTGIDYSKAVIVNQTKFIGNPSHINQNEYNELIKNFQRILTRFKNYVSNYKDYIEGKTSVFEANRYKLSTLQYFHNELGLSIPFQVQPTDYFLFRKDQNGLFQKVFIGNLPDTPHTSQSYDNTLISIWKNSVSFPLYDGDIIAIGETARSVALSEGNKSPVFSQLPSTMPFPVTYEIYKLNDQQNGLGKEIAEKGASAAATASEPLQRLYTNIKSETLPYLFDLNDSKVLGRVLKGIKQPANSNTDDLLSVGDIIVLDKYPFMIGEGRFSRLKNFFEPTEQRKNILQHSTEKHKR